MTRRNVFALGFIFLPLIALPVWADGPTDNDPATVRRVPKIGVDVPPEARKKIESGLGELDRQIAQLAGSKDPRILDLVPDVVIFHKAAADALAFGEFFAPEEIDEAIRMIALGRERAALLLEGKSPWIEQTGLVVRGYRSRIDGSVQPYGMVVPPNFTTKTAGRYRLDVWLHGRGETLSELNFLRRALSDKGTFAPDDTLVLHPYGRYCNAFKFAGEVDVYEALAHATPRYRVDEDRVSIRGFSMGGAGCWQFAVHDPSRWFAANPGAGFSETPEFLKFFQKETLRPEPWEKTLWNWYDCPPYAENLVHLPTIAYSGEKDVQLQAAERMEQELKNFKLSLRHVIGPDTGHTWHPQARETVARAMDQLAKTGRERTPTALAFTTHTLIYPKCHWLTIEGMERQWKKAVVEATIVPGLAEETESVVELSLDNVTDLRLEVPAGGWDLSLTDPVRIEIVDAFDPDDDGQGLTGPAPGTDLSWSAQLHRVGKAWKVGPRPAGSPRKRPGLCGPIDHAFMDTFLFVRPTGKTKNEQVAKWAESEMNRAIEHWRRHFRGVAQVKNDVDVTVDDMAKAHVVLWGDPQSNSLLAKIADRLPIAWSTDAIAVGDKTFPAGGHALAMIAPNPLAPDRYVVLNSGFTFRDYDYLNNARQTPKLPDWAVIDLSVPPGNQWPGKIVAADFFDESWKVRER